YKNRRYKGNVVELTVLNKGTSATQRLLNKAQDNKGKSKDYFLEAIVDNKNPYVNEQITLTLKYFIAIQYYGSPELTEPATTGFWTEILGNKTPYYQKINNRNYKVIERKYALFPTQTGELTIGRATIRSTVASRKRRYRDPFNVFGDFFGRGEEVTIRSLPVKINVKPLPAKGRPSDFTGTIGKFKINSSVNKREVEVNQPVSVTIKISGTGNIKSVAEPVIPELPDFRTYKASSSENISKRNDKIGGTKIYEEVFIPKRPGELEIPALSFNYFDPRQGKYKRISTKLIKLRVTKPEGYISSVDAPYPSPALTIGSQARDIRFIKEDIGNTNKAGKTILTNPLYIFVNGFPVLIFLGMVILRHHREKLSGNIGYARARGASKEARKRLSKAKTMAKEEHVGNFYSEIYTALTSYIADKLNISPYGLTTEKVQQLLEEKAADEMLITILIELMQKCDYVRYTSSTNALKEIDIDFKKAEEIMTIIERIKFD
ncbi:MAG: BatD family protein, partial [Candidatus Zixiibacteriota bacterium]